ncbi:MAG: catalase family protein [Proteobacteria bacterium]|nr:catalase family protein [Pseudomonadota bacterium]
MSNEPTTANPFENNPDPEEETRQIEKVANLTEELLEMRYPAPRPILRGVHPKSHGCVKAVFEVNADIAKNLRVGLFAVPGKKHDAWIRFSNASVRVEHDLKDGKHGSRGMAIKVLDVGGTVLQEDGGAYNQDFLMINQPAFAFANTEDYLRLTKIIREHKDDPTLFFASLQVPIPGITDEQKRRILNSFKIVQQIQSMPVANPLEVRYFSAAPFLFGPNRVMKFSATPSLSQKPQIVPENPGENYLSEALEKAMSGTKDIRFDFQVQVRGKEDGLNIEDASTVWEETEIPFVDVARITIRAPQKEITTPMHIERCERLVFTPWHSLADHQPLGSINRLRRAVYSASEVKRGGGRSSRGPVSPGKPAETAKR